MAQLVALSGAPYWGMYAWGFAWIGCALTIGGFGLFAPSSRWGWIRFRVGLLGGIAAFAALPTLPWWIGLGVVPSLIRESKPAERLLAIWWLVLSIMTPLYHPYARLWLPLHAVGWLIAGGLVVRFGPFQRGGDGTAATANDPWALTWSRPHAILVILIFVLAAIEKSVTGGVPLPPSRFTAATIQFRRVAADLRKGLPGALASHSEIKVLARRPLVFYLLTFGGVRFALQPDSTAVLENGRAGDLVIVDWVQLRSEDDPPGAERRLKKWGTVSHWSEELDPVTLLDVDFSAAFERRDSFRSDVEIRRVR
jgi:hypothetical protein